MAAVPYARKKLVAWRSVVLFGGPGMVGSYFGAALAKFLPAAAQLTLLAAIMLFVRRVYQKMFALALVLLSVYITGTNLPKLLAAY